MPKQTMYAVITGDIIDSSQVEETQKDKLINSLKQSFADIRGKEKNEQELPSFNIFRGDSFQGALENPANALEAALLIRSSLRKNQPGEQKSDWDARIAIGVGTVDNLPEIVSEGDGPAYQRSGPVLDGLKGDHKFAITLADEALNAEFKASCALLDAVINKWTQPQAEIVHMLLQDKTPKKIGKELDISQAAVHYRVKAAGWFAVKEFINRYKDIITEYNRQAKSTDND